MSCDDPFCRGDGDNVVKFDDSWEQDRAVFCDECAKAYRGREGARVLKGAHA